MKAAVFSVYPADSNCPRGGIEAVTVVLVRALAQLGDLDVHVVTLDRGRTSTAVEKDGDITVHRLSGSDWPEILDIFIGPGRRRLVTYINQLQPDVLHTHETYGLALGGIPIPHVHTLHGFDHANLVADSARFARIRAPLWRLAERQGLSRQRHIVSITPYVRKMIEPQTHARIYDVDNPVEERFFHIEHRPESGRVLCAGWIDERKNTLGCVEAFARIANRHPEARLAIAGGTKDAEYFHRVRQSIERHEITDRVEILGHVDRDALSRELARANVLLLPSRQENAPMVVAEAMAAGVPVVASNRCGMPYMIDEGRTGFLVDPESTDEIADRLARLCDSKPLSQQMGQAGHVIAVERFHPRVVAEKTRTIYRMICENKPRTAL